MNALVFYCSNRLQVTIGRYADNPKFVANFGVTVGSPVVNERLTTYCSIIIVQCENLCGISDHVSHILECTIF